jgi:helicase
MANDPDIAELLKRKKIQKLWPAQEMAIKSGLLSSQDNFVVIAPTSSGKTLTAELAIYKTLKAKRRALYLLPMKALLTEKVAELKYLQPDYTVSDSKWTSSVVVQTFETFYRTALLNPNLVRDFGIAVVDEFHVLYDKQRGFNLEKAITLLRLLKIRIVCLSATFQDKSEVAGWLDAQLVEVPESMRAVQLEHMVWDVSEEKNPMEAVYQKLVTEDLKPCLLFCSTKDYSRSRAVQISEKMEDQVPTETLRKTFIALLPNGRDQFTKLENDLLTCMTKRVGFHHAGLAPELRALVEERFRNGQIDYLFATTTLAYGLNFPAEAVVICDLTMFDPDLGKPTDVPVYMYMQMAGRAGRSQYGKEGYVVSICRSTGEVSRAQKYTQGIVEEAFSKIANDDLFRKAILELVFANRNQDSQITDFFEATFFNYQGAHRKNALGTFDLLTIIKEQAAILETTGFLRYMGAAGYKLTPLGKVTLDFLFKTFGQYELEPFHELDTYLEQTGEVKSHFDIVYKLVKDFGINMGRTGSEKAIGIGPFLESIGMSPKASVSEHTAYAIYTGWMENFREDTIENDFRVYSSQISEVVKEVVKLLEMYEALAKGRNLQIPPELEVLKERLAYGVHEDELPFVRLAGIGRETTRSLHILGRDKLSEAPYNYKGTLLEKLRQYSKKYGKQATLSELKALPNIGEVRSKKMLDLIMGTVSS